MNPISQVQSNKFQLALKPTQLSSVYIYNRINVGMKKEIEMTTDTNAPRKDYRSRKVVQQGAASAPIYGLGFIGALVYYLGSATTFWMGVLGFFKAIVWPALLVYEALKYLNM